MNVRCPSCNHNLSVPTKGEDVKSPVIQVNLAGVIQLFANEIDADLLKDDQRLDAFIGKTPKIVRDTTYGKTASDAYDRGEISARELLNSKRRLSRKDLKEISEAMGDG